MATAKIVDTTSAVSVSVESAKAISAKVIDHGGTESVSVLQNGVNASLSILGGNGQRYAGQTVVTPSDDIQTLYTKGYTLTADIVVNPVPSNYGRIGWNGFTLSVY